MRTSVQWINQYLEPAADAATQAESLTDLGLPLDGSEQLADGDLAQEIETTSNRGDCLCHFGLAREIAARTGRRLVLPPGVTAIDGASLGWQGDPMANAPLGLQNDVPALCPLYTGRIIRGVKVRPSPEWLQARLRAIGQVPRNNIVDATNFLLFELGQPTHVFDLATLKGNQINIRMATEGESFLPIGEGAKEVKLRSSDLVIADAERAVAIAGVKGGALTAVRETTTDILIESATFAPLAVRHASRGLRIASDSSYRFERGVSPWQVDEAAERLVRLILELAGGTRLPGSLRSGSPLPPLIKVEMRLAQLKRVLGIEVSCAEATSVLERLGFAVVSLPTEAEGQMRLMCTVPPQRGDIHREIDVVEEVARVIGYSRLPVAERIGVRATAPQASVEGPRVMRDLLSGMGFCECVTHTLISESAAAPFLGASNSALRVNDERAGGEPILRPSLLPSLLRVARSNLDRGERTVQLFECASTFILRGGSHEERRMLAAISCTPSDEATAFRTMVGVVERLSLRLNGCDAAIQVSKSLRAGLISCGLVSSRGIELGWVGMVDDAGRKALGIDQTVAAFELSCTPLLAGYPPVPVAREPANFPAIDRDITAIVGEDIPWARVTQLVEASGLANFESLDFVTAFRGKTVGEGRKAVTMRVGFRSKERTLRREEVDPQVASLVAALRDQLQAEVRS